MDDLKNIDIQIERMCIDGELKGVNEDIIFCFDEIKSTLELIGEYRNLLREYRTTLSMLRKKQTKLIAEKMKLG